MRPDAEVDPVTEADLYRDAPPDPKRIRIVELALVASRGAGEQQDAFAGRDLGAVERHRRERVTALILGRWVVAVRLLDRAGEQAAIVEQQVPLVAVPIEEHREVAEQLDHRLAAGRAQQEGEPGHLVVGEPPSSVTVSVVRFDLGEDEVGDHVVDGMRALDLRQIEEVRVERRGDGHDVAVAGVLRIDAEELIGPPPDLLAVFGRDAEDPRDHLDREQRGEVVDPVELVAAVERVGAPADDLREPPARSPRPRAG